MVEVMLSMAVIGMVIGASYAISNRATQLGRLGQQRTQINNLMRTQAEYIKQFRDNNSSQWQTIKNTYVPSSVAAPSTKITCPISSNSFYVDDSGNVQGGTETTSNNLYNISVVPYRTATYHVDYYVVGCWMGPGSYGQQQSFIVERLNDSI
jgi:hypothetical protein